MRPTRVFIFFLWLLFGASTCLEAGPALKPAKPQDFLYDQAAETIPATMLPGSELYDPAIVVRGSDVWLAWLEYVPGRGDRVWVGKREGDGWEFKTQVTDKPGQYARPTLTVDAAGQLWLTYEALNPDRQQWDVFIRTHRDGGHFGESRRVSPGMGTDINHRVATDPRGGLWIVWQSDCRGQFDVMAQYLATDEEDQPAEPQVVSRSPRGDWHPAVAVAPCGDVCVVWDSYDGDSFNVVSRRRIGNQWKPIAAVADGPAFEARAQVVCDRQGRVWVSWEEGGLHWGEPYRRGEYKRPAPNVIEDDRGPLHRLRKLHVALLEESGAVRHLADPLAMPALEKARTQKNRREGATYVGVSYERGLLAVDRHDRLWIVYRHFYFPRLTQQKFLHHIESGWQLFARCLEGQDWSKLYALDIYQRDGMQRLSIAPNDGSLVAAWTTGRTDRRKDPKPRGVALASFEHAGTGASDPKLQSPRPVIPVRNPAEPARRLKPTEVGGRTYQLCLGDLHRHTDVSLCQPFVDGSFDDAYRYGIEVAEHDFMGITDHACDLDRGNRSAQIWWRSTKDVDRHRLRGTFCPYFAHEKSAPGTDHNVISLTPDILRQHKMPMTTLWKGLDRNTIVIPHIYFGRGVWSYHDDAMRPLLEIYQGARNLSSEKAAHQGLAKGHRMGFICSSDHCSTATSYACVWTPEPSRESIFRSMQARRTYGATAKIRLVFRSGDHWMGEQFSAVSPPRFQIEIDGTAALQTVQVVQDGKPVERLPVPEGDKSLRTTYSARPGLSGSHYVYIHLKQVDGNQAWSSPIWFDIGPTTQ